MQLNRAIEVAPSLPWPYTALAEIYTKRLPAPKPPERPLVEVAREFAAWTKTDKAQPEASLRDSLGKTWSVSSLKGKTTFLKLN